MATQSSAKTAERSSEVSRKEEKQMTAQSLAKTAELTSAVLAKSKPHKSKSERVAEAKAQWLEIIEGDRWEMEGSLEDLHDFEGSLKHHGLYERYLLKAWREAHHGDITSQDFSKFLSKADRQKFRAAGDPIPATGPTVVLWRGVSGDGKAHGVSWTDDVNIACRFATYYAAFPEKEGTRWARNPRLYRTEVSIDDVLCYTNARGEHEYLLDPRNVKPKRVRIDSDEMKARRCCWYWDDDYVLRERFIDAEKALRSIGVPGCEFSNWESASPCRHPATKEIRVACPNASGMRCCDDHYEALVAIPHLKGLIEFEAA